MKKLFLAPIAVAALALAGMGMSGTAAAAEGKTTIATCGTKVKAIENTVISDGIGGSRLGLLVKDGTACVVSRATGSESYTACGATSKIWYRITAGGLDGYVKGTCVTYV